LRANVEVVVGDCIFISTIASMEEGRDTSRFLRPHSPSMISTTSVETLSDSIFPIGIKTGFFWPGRVLQKALSFLLKYDNASGHMLWM
jgi:hypothetical protein